MEKYQGLLRNWGDVQKEYDMIVDAPEDVLLAYYEYENYSGSSLVAYRTGDKYYLNEGSHCSCYGLEGQWKPEEYENKYLFLACLEKREDYDRDLARCVDEIIGALK